MAFQVSPGINVTETDLTTVVPNVSTSIGATGGQYAWGPVQERTTITTENQLVEVFGKPTASTYNDFWTAANYLAYSNSGKMYPLPIYFDFDFVITGGKLEEVCYR